MSRTNKSHINQYMRTSFANSGRVAGAGISYDRYDDESGNPNFITAESWPRFPSDSLTPEERLSLNGEVKVYKMTKEAPNDPT